jgi:hypothetical protein
MENPTDFLTVTIKLVDRRDGQPGWQFRLLNSHGENPMVESGLYETPEAASRAFSPPIRVSYQAAIVSALSKGEPISFSLEHAYDSV